MPAAAAGQLLAEELMRAGLPLAAALAQVQGDGARQRHGWLLPGVPAAAASCMLRLMPALRNLSPATVRQHLAASAAGGQALLKLPPAVQQPLQEEEAGSSMPPPAVAAAGVLLEYCLTDLQLDGLTAAGIDRQLLRQLNGLPLLPMTDGSVQPIKVSGGFHDACCGGLSTPQPGLLACCEPAWLGRGSTNCSCAALLTHHKRRDCAACMLLQVLPPGAKPSCYVIVASTGVEEALLQAAPHLLVHPSLPPQLKAKLLAMAATGEGALLEPVPAAVAPSTVGGGGHCLLQPAQTRRR
jgi:hypothetical protein